jgi:hypothetical protein
MQPEECPARGEQLKHADKTELESGIPLTHCPCWWDGDACCNCNAPAEDETDIICL